MHIQLITPRCTSISAVFFVVLFVASVASAQNGPVGPFSPTAPVATADSDPGKCTQQKGVVYLSTYLSGWQLDEQGFDAPMGSVYFQGPKLTSSRVDGVRGEWCSTNNVAGGIPSMATGIIAWGTPSSNEPMATIYYDVNIMKSRSEFIGCGCRIKVYIRAKPTWATIATTSSTVENRNEVTIDGTCRSECSSLKVYSTQNWCSNPTNSGNCIKGTFGANVFVYFDGLNAAADAAAIGEEGFAAAEGPSSSEENVDATPSAPTSSASKTSTPLPLLISMLALFGVVGNKRVVVVAILLASVVSAAAQPPSWRESLGGALGQILGSYYESLGRCKSHMSEVMISTAIDGKKLKFYFNPSPVGDEKYTGPKMELLGSRTNFAYGDYCGTSAPSVIPPDGFGDIIIGDSYWGLASAEVSVYYKVYKPDGSPSNCVLKLYMNDESSGLERKPIYSLTKEGDCADVPTLKINKLKTGCGTRGRNGGCLSDPKTSINYYSTGFNVYFDGQATAQPASLRDDTFDDTAAQAPAASEDSSLNSASGSETAPPAPSAAVRPLKAAMGSVVAIVLLGIATMF